MIYIIVGLLILVVVFIFSAPKKHSSKKTKSKNANHPERRIELLQSDNVKLIYADKKGSEVFNNREYKISAKPDFIYLVNKELVLIEYKSRKSDVRSSDIHQAMAAALAVRSKYNITKAIVYTTGGYVKEIRLGSNDEVYREIGSIIDKTRMSKSGVNPCITKDKSYRCRYCGYKEICTS